MSEPSRQMDSKEVANLIHEFDQQLGRTSLYLAAHAAVAHRLRPEVVALIRTNFLPSPHRFQAAHDADVLFGPLCRFQGGGFFEMRAEVKDFLVGVLDRLFPPGPSGRFRSQDVARLLRQHLRHAGAERGASDPRYERFRQENLWRAITIDDPLAVRDHMRSHAISRDALPRDELPAAARGAGIAAVAGPLLSMFQTEITYLEAQDLIAGGRHEQAVALLEIMVDAGAEAIAEPRLAPAQLLAEERLFLARRRNMTGEGGPNPAAGHQPTARTVSASANTLDVDRKKLNLRDTALTQAAAAGDRVGVELALRAPDLAIDQLDRYGLAALHHAVRRGHTDLSLRLLDAGADVNIASAHGSTPMHYMCDRGLTDLARSFIARGATLLRVSAKKTTPLMGACWFGHRDLVAFYLAQPEVDERYVNARNDDGFSALFWTLCTGDQQLYDMLIAAGARPEPSSSAGYTQLHAAASGRSCALVELMLESGFPVDPLTSDGWSPLHIACSNTPSLEVVQLLLDCGADPWRETAQGWTPLRIAASWNNLGIFRHLLSLGATPEARLVDDAASNGAHDVLGYLIDACGMPVVATRATTQMIDSGIPAAADYVLARPALFNATPDDVFKKAVQSGAHRIITHHREQGRSLPVLPPANPPAPDTQLRDALAAQRGASTHPWITTLGTLQKNWRETAAALLAWPEARALAGETIFLKAIEKGEAELLRLFKSKAWPVPSADSDTAGGGRWLEALKNTTAGWRDTMEALLTWEPFRTVAAAELFELAVARGDIDVFELFEREKWARPTKPSQKPGWAWVVGEKLPRRDDLVLQLIDRPGGDASPDSGQRLINLVAEAGLMKTLAELIRRGETLEATDQLNEAPLSVAVANGRWPAVQLLLDAGADPNQLTGQRYEPAFFRANAADMALLTGADLRRRALNGRCILHVIVPRLAQPEAQAVLADALAAGLSIDTADVAGMTPLHLVAERGSPEEVRVLLAAGASLEARTGAGLTPLHLAVSRGQRATAAALLDAGADPAARTPGGLSLLHLAAEQNVPDLLKTYWIALAGAGAIALRPPRTVLQVAVEANSTSCVEALLDLKADPNRAAGSTQPPLLLAIGAGHYELAARLLDAGASARQMEPARGHDALSEVEAQQRLLEAASMAVPPALTSLHDRLRGVARPPVQPTPPLAPAPAPAPAPRSFFKDSTSRAAPLHTLLPLDRTIPAAPPLGSSATFLARSSEPAWHGWSHVMGGRVGVYKKALDNLGQGYGAGPISEYATRDLSFYPGIELVRLRSSAWNGRPQAIFLLSFPSGTVWLDGTARALQLANSRAMLNLTADNALEYLRFHCFFVRAEGKPFYLLEDRDDPAIAPLRPTHPALLESAARLATLRPEKDGFLAGATVIHGRACLRAEFIVRRNGEVVMRSGKLIEPDLPISLDLPIR